MILKIGEDKNDRRNSSRMRGGDPGLYGTRFEINSILPACAGVIPTGPINRIGKRYSSRMRGGDPNHLVIGIADL